MEVYRYGNGQLERQEGLIGALGIEEKPHMVISLTGAGGKTSSMYRLAEEFAGRGKRVIVTTTTHIRCPEDREVLLTDYAGTLSLREDGFRILVVAGKQENGKLSGLSLEETSKLSVYADVVLIEADGAKTLPLKVPAAHEPVIIPEADLVIGCLGLSCLDGCWRDRCFRAELAVRQFGMIPSRRIRAEDAAQILCSPCGTKKDVGRIPYRIILNQADNGKKRQQAVQIAECLKDEICVITSYRDDDPAREDE